MDALQEKLQPLIDLLPDKVRDYWWAIYGLAALLMVLIILAFLRGLFRSVFGKGKAHQEDWAKKLREDLALRFRRGFEARATGSDMSLGAAEELAAGRFGSPWCLR